MVILSCPFSFSRNVQVSFSLFFLRLVRSDSPLFSPLEIVVLLFFPGRGLFPRSFVVEDDFSFLLEGLFRLSLSSRK